MKQSYLLIIIGLLTSTSQAQVKKLPDTLKVKKAQLSLEDFAYPIFFNGEEHSSFRLEYPLSTDFELALQGFYDTYLLTNRFRIEAMVKWNMTRKWYLIGGVESESESAKYGRKPTISRIGVFGGMGYDVNDNVLLEARGNFQINNSPMGVYGEALVPMPKVYTLGSKIKF